MNDREIRSIRDGVRHGGNRVDRQEEISSGLIRVREDVKRLGEILATEREFFARELEKWTGRDETRTRPFEVGEQLREAKAYLIAAIFAVAFDAFSGGMLTRSIGLPFWVGSIISVFLVFVMKGGLRFLFRDPERPRFVLERLRRQIVLWSFLTFLFATMVLLSAVRLPGALAAAMLSLYAVALLMTTLSLCLLSASLWVAYQLLSWSRPVERNYAAKEMELREAVVLERHLASLTVVSMAEPVRGNVTTTSDVIAPTVSSHLSNGKTVSPAAPGGAGLAALAILLAGMLSACAEVDAKATGAIPPAVPAAEPTVCDINVMVDLSGSPNSDALREFARNLIRDLPGISRRTCAQRLHVRHIREDAWVARDAVTITLPDCPSPTSVARVGPMGDIANLPNIREALEQASAREVESSHAAAESTYTAKLEEVLSGLSEEKIVPAEISPARCSDIIGSVRRSSYGADSHRLNIIATDGEDSCSAASQVSPIESPDGVVTILFLIPRAGRLGWDEFAKRKVSMGRFLPAGTVVVPHFEDPGLAVQKALANRR